MKLYEINAEFAEIDRLLDETDGEMTGEIESRLDQLGFAFDRKVEAICCVIQNLKGEAEAARNESRRLAALAAKRERRAESLKEYLRYHLEFSGRDKVDTGRFAVSLRKSPVTINWVGEGEPPPEYQRVTVALDKSKAIEAYKTGKLLPDGFEIKQSNHLRIN